MKTWIAVIFAVSALVSPILAEESPPAGPKVDVSVSPEILQVQALRDAIDVLLSKKELSRKASKCPPNEDGVVFERELYRDKKGVARKYVLDGGSEPAKTRMEYYYDETGELRFIYRLRTFENGTRKEERVYFGPDGAHLRADRQESGPGYPDDTFIDFIQAPLDDFAGPCREPS